MYSTAVKSITKSPSGVHLQEADSTQASAECGSTRQADLSPLVYVGFTREVEKRSHDIIRKSELAKQSLSNFELTHSSEIFIESVRVNNFAATTETPFVAISRQKIITNFEQIYHQNNFEVGFRSDFSFNS